MDKFSRFLKIWINHTPKYGDGDGFRPRIPFSKATRTCSVPVLAFENHYVPVPSPYQYFNFDPYPSRTRTCFFKTNPYPYHGRLILLRFRIPVPVPVLKYQVKLSNAMRQIVSRRRLPKALNIAPIFFRNNSIYSKLMFITLMSI